MKRGIVIVLLFILVGTVGGGWWWTRNSPEQVSQFLVDGGLEESRAEEFVALVGGQVQAEQEGILIASGSIEGEEVSIVSEFGGRIVRLDVQEGDDVREGEVLVELDTSSLNAQIAQAEAGVAAARANLETVKAGVHPAEILAAQAIVLQAMAEQDAADMALQDTRAFLENPQEIEARIADAQTAVEVADAQVEASEAQIAKAEAQRFQYRGQGSFEEKGLYQVHDYLVQAAQAGLAVAQTDKAGAEKMLAALQALRDNPLAIASQVRLAEAQQAIAGSGVEVAQTNLAELKAGPLPEEVAVAQAQVARAQAGVSALEAQLDKAALRTPMAGIVTSRSAHAGEAAIAGATLLTVANLDQVHLTIYVPEDELGRVYLGQRVEVTVDSFPGQAFAGVVSHIAQQAEFTPKNVQTAKERVNMVFAVKIRLPNPEHRLKPGMPADAVLGSDGNR